MFFLPAVVKSQFFSCFFLSTQTMMVEAGSVFGSVRERPVSGSPDREKRLTLHGFTAFCLNLISQISFWHPDASNATRGQRVNIHTPFKWTHTHTHCKHRGKPDSAGYYKKSPLHNHFEFNAFKTNNCNK